MPEWDILIKIKKVCLLSMNNPESKTEFFLGVDYWALEDISKYNRTLPVLFVIRGKNYFKSPIIQEYLDDNKCGAYIYNGILTNPPFQDYLTALEFYDSLIKMLLEINYPCYISLYQGNSLQRLSNFALYLDVNWK